ncbi:hypothetical protein PV11_01740 [Exophiala sideris]|uniref:PNPLA domain-containing protein n=1 Tax=Exophiala sideris TaxID=1016849 RepID=A0A0D1WBK5_9EURO|nr:hypothetical protein PV11_01740 [Exophiala sideris]
MPGKELRLLALDGGGVRGLSALMILEQLMQTIDSENPPKPCEYFDMIGGTSTGGLIAIMLGRLEMTVDECIEAYLSLSDQIFQKKAHRVNTQGKIQGRFDSKKLEDAIKEVVRKRKLPEDTLLKSVGDAPCKVFVCATSKETSETVCLTSYKSSRGSCDLFESTKIWEACRATAAASSFFDPISIGRYGEEFVDGATGANNPVWELWNQAQAVYGPEPLEDSLACLVSIGTGVPFLTAFRDDVLHIHKTLIAMSTETEQTAERFRRSKVGLDKENRYHRFNVSRGLEGVGLEESKKRKEIAAATRRYIASQEVVKQMEMCAGSVSRKHISHKYQVPFSLRGVPVIEKFADRPVDMAELRQSLIPGRESSQRQRQIFLLSGMGGMGKTQLAAQYARRHHQHYSAVFWLDGTSEDSLKQSIAYGANRIAQGQIPEASRTPSTGEGGDLDLIVEHFRNWLSRGDNNCWLLVLDNVDREYCAANPQPGSYDIEKYLPDADHGAILITTRLSDLKPYETVSKRLQKVDDSLAAAIFCQWYSGEFDQDQVKPLFKLLDGLPLALTQAAAYMQQSGISFARYIDLYNRRWDDLMKSHETDNRPWLKYNNGSIWTTWTISFEAIRVKNEAAADLLLLWAFLDNLDLWYGLFEESSEICTDYTYANVPLREAYSDEIKFVNAMQLLLNYSLVEKMGDESGYIVHPVVHQWARHVQTEEQRVVFARLAVVTIGYASPSHEDQEFWTIQRRLIGHAECCFHWVVNNSIRLSQLQDYNSLDAAKYDQVPYYLLEASRLLGDLFLHQSKLEKAEQVYAFSLRSSEEILGPEHEMTLDIINNLGILYEDQGKLDKAEQMFERALRGQEKVLGPENKSTLDTVNNLGVLYRIQGKLDEAEQIYERALRSKEKVLGPEHVSTLDTINNLGGLYRSQGKLDKAEQIYERALRSKEKVLGPENKSTLETVNNLGVLYRIQGKLDEAEQMHDRALRGQEKVLGPGHTSTLTTVHNLGIVYYDQEKLDKAEELYERALQGFEKALGARSMRTYVPALDTCYQLGSLFIDLGRRQEAIEMLQRALNGYREVYGPSHQDYQNTVEAIEEAHQSQDTPPDQRLLTQEGSKSLKETASDSTNETRIPNEVKSLGEKEHASKLRKLFRRLGS